VCYRHTDFYKFKEIGRLQSKWLSLDSELFILMYLKSKISVGGMEKFFLGYI